jgi:high-affinity iron transporter
MVSAVQVSGSFSGSVIGLLLGLTISVLVGYLVFKGVLKLNLGKVFATIGAALIVVAAGVLAYGVHEFQESGVLPFLDNTVIDTTAWIDPEGLVGSLLKGFLAYRGSLSPLEIIVWVSFVTVVGLKYRATLNARVVAPVEAEKVSA